MGKINKMSGSFFTLTMWLMLLLVTVFKIFKMLPTLTQRRKTFIVAFVLS